MTIRWRFPSHADTNETAQRLQIGALFTAAVGNGNRIEVTFHYPGFTNEKADLKHFFVAAETLLGEELLDNWIGAIVVGPSPAPGDAEPLSELRPRVEALIDQVHSGLLREPCFAASKSASWTLLKLKQRTGPTTIQGNPTCSWARRCCLRCGRPHTQERFSLRVVSHSSVRPSVTSSSMEGRGSTTSGSGTSPRSRTLSMRRSSTGAWAAMLEAAPGAGIRT